MSIPYTSTHSVSLRDNWGVKDNMKSRLVSDLKHPIQRVNHRLGSDPQHWTYGGFYDLDDLRPWISNGRLDCNQFDDVVWTDVPQGWHPPIPNYAQETRHILQQGCSAKVRAENQQRFQQRETVLRAAQSRLTPQLYSEISHLHGSYEDKLAGELSDMRLGKRPNNYYGYDDGRGSNKR